MSYRTHAPSIVFAAGLALASGTLARAQDKIENEVDAPYRLHDVVWVEGQAKPLTGTITAGREPGPHKLVIRLVNDIETEVSRERVTKLLERQTPNSAFKNRAARVATKKDAGLHRRLAEWALGHGLQREGEAQLELAAKHSAPSDSISHRERVIDLYETRLGELDDEAPERAAIQERILGHAAVARGTSPRLLIARARVQLDMGLATSALPLLARARTLLDARAKEPAPPGGEDGGGEDGGEDGGGEDGGEDGGGREDGGGGEDGEKTDEGEPRKRPPPRRFGRGGEELEPEKRPKDDPAPAVAPTATDRAAELLSGLTADQRRLYRDMLGDQARAALAAKANDVARGAYQRRLEIWPEDPAASIGFARLAAREGKHAEGVQQLSTALKVHNKSPELLLLRGQLRYLSGSFGEAQSDFERALHAVGGDATAQRPIRTALGLVHLAAGRPAEAKTNLEAADAEPGYGPARLGRALLSEIEGDLTTAEVNAKEALRLLGTQGGEAHYLRSFALQKAGKVDEAASALAEAIREGYDFELGLRARIDLARAREDRGREARLTELLVRSAQSPTPTQLAALGRIYLQQSRPLEAQAQFSNGLKLDPTHGGCLRGLAYCAYVRDERLKAYALFKQLLEQDKADAWAARGLKHLDQARSRRVWTDDFDRPDGDVLNAWTVESPFGVLPRLAKGALRFEGKQANDAQGKTQVFRAVQGEVVVKFAVKLKVGPGNQGRMGVRFEGRTLQAVLFRDPADGRIYASTRRGKQPWTDPADLGPWTHEPDKPESAHTLAIDVEDPKSGVVAFLVDGERRGEVKVGSLARPTPVTLTIYAQATQLGEAIAFDAEQVWIYVLRPEKKKKQGGF